MSGPALLGAKEIAELLGVDRQTVYRWRMRGRLPEPDHIISEAPVWTLATIHDWAIATGRLDAAGKPIVRSR